jgi:hypothetical protein
MPLNLRPAAALLALPLVLGPAAPAGAAETAPFLFTVTTLHAPQADERWIVRYEAGYGGRTAEPFGFDGMLQRLAVQGSLPKGFTVVGQVDLGLRDAAGTTASSSQELEVLKDVRGGRRGFALAVGMGMRHEWQGTSVILGRISAGHRFADSSLFGNVRFERPLQQGRDAVDLITTLGWTHRIGSAVHAGVEAVGEDLEGFWEPEEAEGGAKLFVGPSLRVSPSQAAWSVSMAGGPVVYATRSGRTSPAARPLEARDNAYTLRVSFGYSF